MQEDVCAYAPTHTHAGRGLKANGRGGLTLTVFLEHVALFLCPRKQLCLLTEDKKDNGVLFSLSTQVSLEGEKLKAHIYLLS